MTTSMVELVNIEKRFKDFVAAKDINLKVKSGEFLTLLGPSGCGKTTTLRMIAGFEQPSEGEVWIDGEQVDSIEPYKRDVNTVFQSYALFPHMNIFDNIAFGLKMKKVKKNEIKQRVQDILKLVQLEQFAERKPDQLSGGQKQRVAIARALVNNPKVLLLDEPLGALDLRLRKQMQVELKHLQKRLGITFIYVTHDQEEALTMSDRIIVMNQGLIEQIGSPSDIYERPRTRFIADFIGETNIFEGEYLRKEGDYVYISCEGSEITCLCPGEEIAVSEKVYVAVRPENMDLTIEPKENVSLLNCVFKEKIYIGSVTKLVMELPSGESIIVNETDENKELIDRGEKVQVCWQAKDSVLLTS